MQVKSNTAFLHFKQGREISRTKKLNIFLPLRTGETQVIQGRLGSESCSAQELVPSWLWKEFGQLS